MDDWQLLKSYGRDGSQDAFTQILVYSAALGQVRDPELAKAVTQFVFAKPGSLRQIVEAQRNPLRLALSRRPLHLIGHSAPANSAGLPVSRKQSPCKPPKRRHRPIGSRYGLDWTPRS